MDFKPHYLAQPCGSRRLADSNRCNKLQNSNIYDPPELTPSLGYRLSGYADGEGHFGIVVRQRRSRGRGVYNRPIEPLYSCVFVCKARADDRPLLERFQIETGLGKIYENAMKQTPGRANCPAAQWRVQTKGDCGALVEIFETYPLWSKKAAEFAVWAQAVRNWNGRIVDRDPWPEWHAEIRRLRKYKERSPQAKASA